jgi:hypothetical protein
MKKLLLTFSVFAALVLSSCGKYEEGPKFTLESKKSRLVGNWNVTSVKKNGVEQSLPGTTVEYDIKEDGTYIQRLVVTVFGQNFTDSKAGTWKFSPDKNFLLTKEIVSGNEANWRIIKLSKQELKFRNISNQDTIIQILAPR